ncbi:MAG: twin-arginine translocation signal domain-containing protein, partial [Acidobacteria bacterium]|nr:twin-arginine translocation signal domain-containing protein [Acidobacteriota bacterium]
MENPVKDPKRSNRPNRRKFLKMTSTGALGVGLGSLGAAAQRAQVYKLLTIEDFMRPDSAYHGDAWETLTPGHWKIHGQALRRDMEQAPDPPFGMLWRRAWKLKGDFRIEADFTVLKPGTGDGHELFGICFGGKSLYEGWHGGGLPGEAAWYAAWRGNGAFGVYDHSTDEPRAVGPEQSGKALKGGDRVTLAITVSPGSFPAVARLTVEMWGAASGRVLLDNVHRETVTEGFFGLVARGDVDFQVDAVRLAHGPARSLPRALPAPLSDLIVAVPLGTTLRHLGGQWRLKILCLFRSEGTEAVIRVSGQEPAGRRWKRVPLAGQAPIVTNSFRHHTAVVDVTLPGDPAETDFHYTVWKDGNDVTRDPRTASYAGRLPKLNSPYKLCGLSCHAISAYHYSEPVKCFPWRFEEPRWHSFSNPEVYEKANLFQEGWLFEQPRPEAFRHIDQYQFQVLLWEDDIWYLEIPIFPANIADVYRIIGLTLGGKLQRRMMMRHWNVLNPGDHDFGMDDVKGTEQYAVRTVDELPQDGAYLRRNFAAVWHMVTGEEEEHTRDAPVRYTRWQMPKGDFSLIVTDARLWRTTQATSLWQEKGWEGIVAWQRSDPTRSLLGEQQYAWLEQVIRTDPAPLIAVTGLNALHTVWG